MDAYWSKKKRPPARIAASALLLGLLLVGCSGWPEAQDDVGRINGRASALGGIELQLPNLTAVDLEGRPLRVIATTSVIGEVASQVGADLIQVETLIRPGQDPHGFTASAQTLASVHGADVVLVNGWGLEEALIDDLAQVAQSVPIVPVSAGITPRLIDQSQLEQPDFDQESTPKHTDNGRIDPHVWLSIPNVEQWAATIADVLSALDPANAANYGRQAERYRAQLRSLEAEYQAQLSSLPSERRQLVTTHQALGYFADQYNFTILGSLRAGGSSLAEPTAADLSELMRKMEAAGVCWLLADAGEDDSLTRIVAAELDHCSQVEVVTLYTGGLGPPGSDADTYVKMMRLNLQRLMAGLQ